MPDTNIQILKRGSTPVPNSYREIEKMYIRPSEKSFVKECLYALCCGSGDGYPGVAHILCGFGVFYLIGTCCFPV